jgi:hypothetical protein
MRVYMCCVVQAVVKLEVRQRFSRSCAAARSSKDGADVLWTAVVVGPCSYPQAAERCYVPDLLLHAQSSIGQSSS